jgi:hypothetical protein
MTDDYDVVSQMREEIAWLRELHGTRINEQVIQHIEERNVIFVEDGVNIQEVINEGEAAEVEK